MTLDANEQYADLSALAALVDRLDRDAALAPIATRLLYVEQPMPRDITRKSPLGELAKRDFIVDEADDSYDAFPAARALGYRGISSKACKGIYKSLLNGARAAHWCGTVQARTFLAAEDLTCQAGLAVQQDTALLAFHGIAHSERNGHHYVGGFAATPADEIRAFLTAHPDLYEDRDGEACLVSRNDPMHDSVPYLRNALKNDTDILQEYFVPRQRLVSFIQGLKGVVRRHDANLLNASVRVVGQESNFLSYAPRPAYSVVLYFNQRTDAEGNAKMARLTSDLIDLTHAQGGRFFLPWPG